MIWKSTSSGLSKLTVTFAASTNVVRRSSSTKNGQNAKTNGKEEGGRVEEGFGGGNGEEVEAPMEEEEVKVK